MAGKGNSGEYGDDKGRGGRKTDAKPVPRDVSAQERKLIMSNKAERAGRSIYQGVGRASLGGGLRGGSGKEALVTALTKVLDEVKGNSKEYGDDKGRGGRKTEPRTRRGAGGR